MTGDNHQVPPDVAALAARAAAQQAAAPPIPVANVQVQFQYGPANAHVQRVEVPGHGTHVLVVLTTPGGAVGTFWKPEQLQGFVNKLTEAMTGITVAQMVPPLIEPK